MEPVLEGLYSLMLGAVVAFLLYGGWLCLRHQDTESRRPPPKASPREENAAAPDGSSS